MTTPQNQLSHAGLWVDPFSLPNYGDTSEISGNAPAHIKRLSSNTLGAYGVGSEDCFAYSVGRRIKLVEVSVDQRDKKRWEATTIAEVIVSKGQFAIYRPSRYHPIS